MQLTRIASPLESIDRFIILCMVVVLTAAELLMVFGLPVASIALNGALLAGLLSHAARVRGQFGALLAVLSIAPLLRIIAAGLPLAELDLSIRLALINVPLIIAAGLLARSLGYTWKDLGLQPGTLRIHAWLIAIGILIGIVERLVIQPAPLTSSLRLSEIWWPVISLMLFTGFSEEFIFRGVMQRAAVNALGAPAGVVLIAIVFGILHITWGSLLDVILVTLVGLLFGLVALRDRSIVGTSIAHGIANVMLFIVLPHLWT